MRPELTQLTRERLASASDPVQYARSQGPDIEDISMTPDEAQLPSKFADILEYPADEWPGELKSLNESLKGSGTAAEHFARFCARAYGMPLVELQELYAQSFDLNPNCALEIGYHLFGEDYKRGAFLANLRETQGELELGQEQQLPDYLPVLLRLLVHLKDDELRGSLAGHCMVPRNKEDHQPLRTRIHSSIFLRAVLASLENALCEPSRRTAGFDQ
ncbi:MAG: hypothetical protein R2682_13660 [Pyrinomonadaceae bacterium]